MPHLVAVIDMIGGTPDTGGLPHSGSALIYQAGNFGLYMLSGTAAQLTALNALPQVRGLVAMTSDGATKWAELDGVISATVRTKLNTWLTARGYPNIPAGWTYRQVVRALIRRLRSFGDDTDEFADWVLSGTWVKDD